MFKCEYAIMLIDRSALFLVFGRDVVDECVSTKYSGRP